MIPRGDLRRLGFDVFEGRPSRNGDRWRWRFESAGWKMGDGGEAYATESNAWRAIGRIVEIIRAGG